MSIYCLYFISPAPKLDKIEHCCYFTPNNGITANENERLKCLHTAVTGMMKASYKIAL